MTDTLPSPAPDAVVPQTVVRLLAGIAGLLILAHLTVVLLRFIGGYVSVCELEPMFNLDEENNVPTFYSSTILLFCSCLLAVIALWKTNLSEPFARYWTILAIIFLLLAGDEAISFHELVSFNIKRVVHTSGLFYYAWVIPGIIFVVVFAAGYGRFWWHLPAKTRWLFFASAALFVAGAIGMELFGGRHCELYGRDNLSYNLLVMAEEGLEMAGIILFIHALLDYLSSHEYGVRIRF